MSTQTTARPARRRLAVKLNADSRVLVYTVVVLVALLGATSLAASFSGLIAVAEWARLRPELRWTTPVGLDGAILVYTAAALVRRARGESTRLAWIGVIAGTTLSATANAVHVLAAGTAALDAPWVRAVGAGIAALAPILAALSVHQLADLAVAGPDEDVAPARRQRAAQRATLAAPPPVLEVAAPVALQPQQPRSQAQNVNVVDRDGSPRSKRTYTPEQRAEALALAAQGQSQRQIADAVGASKSVIQSWLSQAVSAGQTVYS